MERDGGNPDIKADADAQGSVSRNPTSRRRNRSSPAGPPQHVRTLLSPDRFKRRPTQHNPPEFVRTSAFLTFNLIR